MIETNCSDPAGPFQTQQDHFRPSRTISDPAGPFQTQQDHFRPSRTISDPAGPFQCWQDQFRPSRTISVLAPCAFHPEGHAPATKDGHCLPATLSRHSGDVHGRANTLFSTRPHMLPHMGRTCSQDALLVLPRMCTPCRCRVPT